MVQMYEFCVTMNCSPEEYEARPHRQSMWLLKIHETKQQAMQDAQERANRQQAPPRNG